MPIPGKDDIVSGVILHHQDAGSGPPVLFVHAGVCDSRMWNRQLVELAASHSVLAPDLRGFGQSPLMSEAYSDAGDLLTLLDHLGLEEISLVGASSGGQVALELVSCAPTRVSQLLLLSATADGVDPTPSLEEFAAEENALIDAGDIDGATELNVRTWLGPEADDAARSQVRLMQRNAFTVQLAAGEDINDEHVTVDLSSVDVPTQVISGLHDLDFFLLVARYLTSTLPNARLVELPWAGHLPSLERPVETMSLIRDWLGSR